MDIVRTSINLTKTFRNVGRLKEIVSVFAKNGFAEFISRGVTTKIPDFVLPSSQLKIKEELDKEEEQDWPKIVGKRIRICFEELGPTFIKFGQLLSSRDDLFPNGFIDEMKLLRDKVKGVPFSDSKKLIENSLGRPIEDIFLEVNPHPIGTASIGVVYKAKLLDGSEVVVKVRRPGIEKSIEVDFSILSYLATQAERMSEEVKYIGISRVLHDFAISLQSELNFNIEALNCERFKVNLEKKDTKSIFYVPKIYKEYTRENVLVMEYLSGVPFSDQKKIDEVKSELVEKFEYGIELFVKSFLQDGFFHADLHGGNFFLLDNGKIGIIDFGLMGSLTQKSRMNFVSIIYSLLTYNYENLVYEFLDVAVYEDIPDIDKLIIDVRDSLSQFVGLTVQQTNFSILLRSTISTLTKHQIYLPRDWFIVFRSLMTLDGVGKDIGIDFDIFRILNDDIKDIIKNSYNKDDLIEEAIWTGKDLLSSLRVVPRHLRWFLKDFAKKGYAVEIVHTGHEKGVNSITNSVIFLGHTVLTGVFISAGVSVLGDVQITHWSQVSLLSWVFWLFGLVSFFKGSIILKK